MRHMVQLKKITNMDKVTLALLLEEGRAKISELEFHLNLTKKQIAYTLNNLMEQGMVVYEASSSQYTLL